VEENCIQDGLFVVAVCQEDKERLKQLYLASENKIFIVENGMDFSFSRRLTPAEKEALKRRIGISGIPCGVFIGSYHGPNIEALREIEKMCELLPEVLFLIAGTVCDASSSRPPENLKPLGLLSEEEKALLLSMSDFALNPVITGSGSNLKLLEYIAFFLPVVTTPFGIRGFDFTEDHLFVAELSKFPEKILEVINDHDLEERPRRAWDFARSRYDWKILGKKLLLLLEDFVKKV
ncbi:MAG: glycosyltransferase, partial [Thermofilaceae archaeon]